MMQRKWFYHKTEGAAVFDLTESDRLHADGWRDTPAAFTDDEQPEPPIADEAIKTIAAGITPHVTKAPVARRKRT